LSGAADDGGKRNATTIGLIDAGRSHGALVSAVAGWHAAHAGATAGHRAPRRTNRKTLFIQGVNAAPFVRVLAQRFNARVTLFSSDNGAGQGAPQLQREVEEALPTKLTGIEVDRVAGAGDPAYTSSISRTPTTST
jgi:hypothetical protein